MADLNPRARPFVVGDKTDPTTTSFKRTDKSEKGESSSILGSQTNRYLFRELYPEDLRVILLSRSEIEILFHAPTMAPPKLTSYLEATGDGSPDGRHVWLTEAGMNVAKVVPGIPPAFEKEILESRALYVVGVPQSWQLLAFKQIFKACGTVDKCPCIIDLEAEQTFRWVIMSTEDEANTVMQRIDGMLLQGNTVRVCKALPPGDSFILSDEYPLERFLQWGWDSGRDPAEAGTVHGHPAPPATQQQHAPTSSQPASSQPASSQPAAPEVKISAPATVQPAPDGFVTQAASWANIARAARGGSLTVDLHPESRPLNSVPRLHPVGRIPSISSTGNIEPMAEQMRVVFILNLPQNITLADISDAIKEGSVHSIRFGLDESEGKKYVGVIFQYASDAESFYQVLRKERADGTPGRFRFIVDAVRGEAFLGDDMIKLMGPPSFATRRLTIVKSRFFFMYKESEFRLFCEKTVGRENIQCIWIYNGGNATVVFADVKSAVHVKRELDKKSDVATGEDPFRGLQVTFSKDPCVQEINFITDM